MTTKRTGATAGRRRRLRACAGLTVETSLMLARLARGEVRRQLPGALTVLDIRALGYIERHPSCGPSDVAAFLDLSAPSATKLLEPLVTANLLTRETGAGDRRRRALALTSLGRARLDDARRASQALFERRLEPVGDAELAEMERAMQTLQRLFGPGAE